MGWLSSAAKKLKKTVKKITPKPLRKPISKVTRQTQKVTRPVKRVSTGYIKTAFTGKLDGKGAAGLALINPVLAINKYPRETLLAGGAVAGGSYLAGASAANAGAGAAAGAGTGAGAAAGAGTGAGGSYLAGASAANAGAGAAAGAGTVAGVGSVLLTEGGKFVTATVIKNEVAKKQKKEIEAAAAAEAEEGQKLNMSPVMQPQTVPKPGAANQLMTPAVIIGGVSLLITLMNRN